MMNHLCRSARNTCYYIVKNNHKIYFHSYQALKQPLFTINESSVMFRKSSSSLLLINGESKSSYSDSSKCKENERSPNCQVSSHIDNHQSLKDKNRIPKDNCNAYESVVRDLNNLQSNSLTIAQAKYNQVDEILPLFRRHLSIVANISDLNKLNVIHIAGTKGKGSTCAYIESILRKYGFKTGFYNSPHLIKVSERIRINGLSLEDSKFVEYFRVVYDKLYESCIKDNLKFPSYFSFLTILSFHVFLKEKVDCAIVEVGIGGEYDPTNVIEKPIVCGITALDFDHTHILGSTIEQIARTKAGIAKKGVPLITCEQEYPTTIQVIKERAAEAGAPVYVCNNLNELFENNNSQLGIAGSVQNLNATLACNIVYQWLAINNPALLGEDVAFDEQAVYQINRMPIKFKDGLKTCRWPGRCEIISDSQNQSIKFFIDGAHTRSSMINCRDWFLSTSEKLAKNSIKILLINIIGNRDRYQVLNPLVEAGGLFKMALFSTNKLSSEEEDSKMDNFTKLKHNEKAVENAWKNKLIWEELMNSNDDSHAQIRDKSFLVFSTVQDTMDFVRNTAENHCFDTEYHVLVTGSLHFAGAVKSCLAV